MRKRQQGRDEGDVRTRRSIECRSSPRHALRTSYAMTTSKQRRTRRRLTLGVPLRRQPAASSSDRPSSSPIAAARSSRRKTPCRRSTTAWRSAPTASRSTSSSPPTAFPSSFTTRRSSARRIAPGPVRGLSAAELARVDAGFHFEIDGKHPFRGQGIGVPRLDDVLREACERPRHHRDEGRPAGAGARGRGIDQEGRRRSIAPASDRSTRARSMRSAPSIRR